MEDAYRRFTKAAETDPELAQELAAIKGNEREIASRFSLELSFGTAGLRGVMGAGSARMNLYTVSRASNGLYDHVAKSASLPVFVVAYDTRLQSDRFALRTAQVLAGRGARVYLASRPIPVPLLSYAIRYLHASAGVCITASHNPAQYNGYKAYGATGCQLLDEDARAVEAAMRTYDYFTPIGTANGTLTAIPEEVYESYFALLSANSICPDLKKTGRRLQVVYSPLNGTGLEFVPRALKDLGCVDVHLVPEQAKHDGSFPTCPKPNPELPEALGLAVKLAKEKRADLVLATDPDCDRVGIAVPDKGGDYKLLTGNETGLLLFEFLCRMKPRRPAYACTTIVSTPLADAIAEAHGVEMKRTLTGFKYIGTLIEQLAAQGCSDRFLFGFEESYGYLASDRVRDKDAVEAAARICEMALSCIASGKTLLEELDALYARFGYAETALYNYEFSTPEDANRASRILEKMHTAPLKNLCGSPVTRAGDYLAGVITDASGAKKATGLPRADVLSFETDTGLKLMLRPSGTEPKCKLYCFSCDRDRDAARRSLERLMKEAVALFS